MRISLNKQTILLLTIITGIVITASITYMTSVGTCVAVEDDVGFSSVSFAYVEVYSDHTSYVDVFVKDLGAANILPAAHFVIKKDGIKIAESLQGVPPLDKAEWIFHPKNVQISVEGIAEGYVGVLDSRADAKAYWSIYCPVNTPTPIVTDK